jgi:hypothetical protein
MSSTKIKQRPVDTIKTFRKYPLITQQIKYNTCSLILPFSEYGSLGEVNKILTLKYFLMVIQKRIQYFLIMNNSVE